MTDDDRDAAALEAGLAEQKALYLAMEGLAARQPEALASDDPAALERLLGEKQSALNRAGDVETRLAGPRARWHDVRERLAPERRAGVERLIDEVGAVLQRLMALESEGRALLEARRRDTATAIDAARRRRQLPGAYRAAGPGPDAPRFVDNNL